MTSQDEQERQEPGANGEQAEPPSAEQPAEQPPVPETPAAESPAGEPAPAAGEPAGAPAAVEPAPRAEGGPTPRGEGGGQQDRERPRRRGRFGRRKVCMFCVDKVDYIDYKDPARLRRYVSDRARIEPRRKTGTCAKHQRRLSIALKRARHLALLPYTADHIRLTGVFAPRS